MLLDDGLDDGNSYFEQYEYWNGHTHRGGRGWLGFERIRVRRGSTSQMGLQSITDRVFDNRTYDPVRADFPFAGRVERVIVRQQLASPDRAYMMQDQTTWSVQANVSNPSVYALLPEERRQREWERSIPNAWCPVQYGWAFCDENIGSTADVIAQTTSTFDDYGNAIAVTRSIVRPGAGVDSVRSVETVFDNDPGTWLINHPSEMWVVDETPTVPVQTRHIAFEHDPGSGLLEGLTVAPSEPDFRLEKVFARDERGNLLLTSTYDAVGEVRDVTLTWDAEGVYPATRTNPMGHQETFVYHPGLGLPTHHVDPNGLTHVRTYDGFGRLVASERRSTPLGPSDGAELTITYSKVDDGGGAYHLRLREQRAGGEDVSTDYDRLGRPTTANWYGFSGAENYRTLEYDHFRRLHRESVPTPVVSSNPAGYHTYFYDVQGRTTGIVAPDGTSVGYAYSRGASGTTVRVTDEEQNVTTYVLDALGRPRQVFDATLTFTCYAYGGFDSLVLVQRDCFGSNPPVPMTIGYDDYGRRTSLHDESLGLRVFDVNAWGDVVSEHDANGQTIEFDHDKLGRLRERVDDDGVSTWEWDTQKLGLLRRSTSAALNRREYSYDSFSRLSLETTYVDAVGEAFDVVYGYDGFSRLSTTKYPGPQSAPVVETQRLYDAHGNFGALRNTTTNEVYWQIEEADAANRIKREAFSNGAVTHRGWDVLAGTLQSIRSSHPQTGVFQSQQYRWTDAKNLHRRDDALHGQAEFLEYDELHRLKTSTVVKGASNVVSSVQYDNLGNILHRTGIGDYDYDGARLVEAGSTAYHHDDNGNIVLRGGDVLVYTAFDKVKRISGPSAAVDVGYDADGARVLKEDHVERKTTVYVDGLYERVTGTDGPIDVVHKYYLHGSGRVVTQLEMRPGLNGYSIATRYVHDEHLGSTDVLTDQSGVPIQRMSFDAWGRRRDALDWTLATEFVDAIGMNRGYTGHSLELEGGLIDMRGRMYDPRAAQFMSPDPIVAAPFNPAVLNRYSYVLNNPLRLTDPSGHVPVGHDEDVIEGRLEVSEDGRSVTWTFESKDGGESETHTFENVEVNGVWGSQLGLSTYSGGEGVIIGLPTDRGAGVTAASAGACAGVACSWAEAAFDRRNDKSPEHDRRRFETAAEVHLGMVEWMHDNPADISLAITNEIMMGWAFGRVVGGAGYVGRTVRGWSQAVPMGASLVGTDATLARASQWIKPMPGAFDVLVHGSSRTAHVLHNGQWVQLSHRSLANFMKANGYRGGPVRLLSCSSGGCATGMGQNLANKLGAEVTAPSGKLWVHPNGRLTIGPSKSINTGTWEVGRGWQHDPVTTHGPPRASGSGGFGRPWPSGRRGRRRGRSSSRVGLWAASESRDA